MAGSCALLWANPPRHAASYSGINRLSAKTAPLLFPVRKSISFRNAIIAIMEPQIGLFAIVNDKGILLKTIIEEVQYFNGAVYCVRCASLDQPWHRGFWPSEIKSILPNPDRDHYLAERKRKEAECGRYVFRKF